MNSTARILVVDDDQRLCDLLKRYLEREGYEVDTANNGEQMRRSLEQAMPELIILDLMLPTEDGLSLARELRHHANLGIIILTAKTQTADRIIGLEVGADDYIPKPFDRRELLARVRSVLRRSGQKTNDTQTRLKSESIAHFAGWRLDSAAHELISPAGDTVQLTSNEFKLLSGFVKNSNRLLSRGQILHWFTSRDWHPDDRSVDVLLGKLRRKLQDDSVNPSLIKTIRGEGYKFTAHVKFE